MAVISLKSRLSPAIRRFMTDESGSSLLEFLLIMPLLIWAWVGIFFYWDAFKAINLVQKATYTIADNVSRSGGNITPAYIDGLEDFLAYLTVSDDSVELRVSSIGWDAVNEQHTVEWSYSPHNDIAPVTAADLAKMEDRLPTLVEFETLILVETQVNFVQPLSITSIGGIDLGLGSRTLTEFIPTTPRFVPKLCLEGTVCTVVTNNPANPADPSG